ncbi:hypothetical protein J2W35_001835 [Variovorax boronicumulans]|nr:hypothetical protein [Variovorax boronicumulans]
MVGCYAREPARSEVPSAASVPPTPRASC